LKKKEKPQKIEISGINFIQSDLSSPFESGLGAFFKIKVKISTSRRGMIGLYKNYMKTLV